jgi:chorismate synthase
MTGVERGRVVHWSDMLAVRHEARNLGIGLRLKLFQREAARAAGADRMYWTYDPLVARNAHLNVNKLGVRAVEYVVDMYGDTGSELHRLGTDRLIVAWPLHEAADAARISRPVVDTHGAPILNAEGTHGWTFTPPDDAPAVARIVVPLDIGGLQLESPAAAAAWRESTRPAFRWALAAGYQIDRFDVDAAGGRGAYVLRRTTDRPVED